MLMIVERFAPSTAYPIANFLILICSIVTFSSGVSDKALHPDNHFVDYEFALIVSPLLLIGAKIGTILNKMMFKIFLTMSLFTLIMHQSRKIYRK
jgi:hypothetical protein